MNVTVKCFGIIAETVEDNEISIELSNNTVSSFRKTLETYYPQLSEFTFQIAVNHKLVGADYRIDENDEIAVLPPFSGG